MRLPSWFSIVSAIIVLVAVGFEAKAQSNSSQGPSILGASPSSAVSVQNPAAPTSPTFPAAAGQSPQSGTSQVAVAAGVVSTPLPAPGVAAASTMQTGPVLAPFRELSATLIEHTRDLNEQERKYREFLEKNTNAQIEFLKQQTSDNAQLWVKWYDKVLNILWGIAGVLGAIAAVIVPLLSLVGWNYLKKLMEDKLTDKLKSDINPKIDNRVREFEGELEKKAGTAEEKIKEVLNRLNERIDKLDETYSTGIAKIEALADLASGLSFAAIVLSQEKSPTIIEMAINELQQCWNHFPDHRRLAIYLGRLYEAVGNIERAIEVLTNTIEKRVAKGLDQGKPQDHAALLYNRACYNNRLAEKKTEEERKPFQQKAREDLRLSICLDPDNLTEANADPDLTSLKPPGDSFDSLLH